MTKKMTDVVVQYEWFNRGSNVIRTVVPQKNKRTQKVSKGNRVCYGVSEYWNQWTKVGFGVEQNQLYKVR